MPLRLIAGPRTRARSSSCSTAISPRSTRRGAGAHRAEPVGRRPRRARAARPPAGAPRRHDRHVRRPLRAHRAGGARRAPAAPTAQRALLVRRVVARRRLNGLSPLGALGGFADALVRTLGELESGLLEPDDLDGDARRALRRATAPSSTASASGTATCCARRAVERLQSDLDAWHGEPVFAYGFEDLTGAQWALLEALAGRTEVTRLAPVRAGPAGVRVAPAHRRGSRSASPPATIEELPPRYGESRILRSRISSARSSPTRRATHVADRRRGPLLRGRRRARRARARRRGAARAAPRRHAARADRHRLPERRARPRAARDRARHARHPVRGRRRGPPHADAVRPGAHLAACASRGSAGRAASSSRFLRSPFSGLERRAVDFVEGRLRGRAVQAPERVVEEAEKLHGAPLPALAELARRRRPGRGGARARGADAAQRLRARAAAGRRDVAGSTCGRTRRSTRLLTELERWRDARAASCRARTSSAALERHTLRPLARRRAGPRRRRRPPARAHAPLRRRLRARPRGGEPAAPRLVARRSSTTTRGARSTSAARGSQRPDPVEPRPLPLLHGVHARARAALSRARGGDRRRQPARAEPVLGRGAGASSTPTTCAAGRGGGRSRRSPGRSRTRRPSASGCARSRSSPRATAAAPTRSRARTAGSGASSARCSAFRAPDAAHASARARAARREARRSTSPSSSASPTARRPGSSSGSSTRARSTRRSTRSCAAPSRTTRSTSSSRALPKELGVEQLERERRRGGGAPDARVPRRGACRACAWT